MLSFDDALKLAQEGRAPEAERLLRGQVARTIDASLERTRALFDLSNLLVACGDLRRSVEPLRAAVAISSTGHEHEKLRLTGAMNLGEILVRLGQLDEADQVLREGLDARRTFYGEDHPGYAYGLEALAQVQFARGDVTGSLASINAAVTLFWDTGNERVAHAFATRAPIARAAGGRAFNQVGGLTDELFDRMVGAVLGADEVAALLQLDVIDELLEVVSTRPGASDWKPQIYASLSTVARAAGPAAYSRRIAAVTWLVEHMDSTGDAEQALGMVLALALARDEGGEVEPAAVHYRDAEARALRLHDPRARARVGRNHGLFLSQRGHGAEARVRLDAALADARRSTDQEEIGRTAVAQGILLQHLGEHRAADDLLTEGVRLLPTEHADAVCARSHLTAVRAGETCGCGETTKALASTVLEMIRRNVPADLVADVAITLPDGTGEPPNVEVQLTREPTPTEVQALDSAVNLAVARLQNSVRAQGLAPAK